MARAAERVFCISHRVAMVGIIFGQSTAVVDFGRGQIERNF